MASMANIFVALAFWLTLLTGVTSNPVPGKTTDKSSKTLSIPLTHNADVQRHGASEYYKTLMKYNLPIPDGLKENVETYQKKKASDKAIADQEGTIPAISNDGDLMWLAPFDIGTPPQQIYLDLDTGSTDTWMFSNDTKKSQVAGQTLYDPSKSSTASRVQNCTWEILYGDFSTSQGICYKDTIRLGDVEVPGMTIESATIVSAQFTETKAMSGLVGLAWPAIAQTTPQQKSLIEFLPEVLSEPVFTVDFKHNDTGSFNFGYIDDALHGSDIEYVGVDTTDGFWTVRNTGFAIDGDDLAYTFETPKDVIVDTGSTLLYAPDAAVDTYFDAIPGANFSYDDYGYVVPCDAQLPDFKWTIGDDSGASISGRVPGTYLVYAHVSDTMCYAGMQSLGAFSGVQGIFGDVFLKSGFAVFDIAGKRFGYAPKTLTPGNTKRDGEEEGEGDE